MFATCIAANEILLIEERFCVPAFRQMLFGGEMEIRSMKRTLVFMLCVESW